MFGEVNFGFSIAFTSPMIPFLRDAWGISEMQLNVFNAILSGIGILGPYVATFMLKYMGRRPVFSIMQFATAVLYLLMLTANKDRFWVMILMRALMGITIGSIQSTAPTMLVEVAPEGISGFFGNLVQTGICIGMIIFYLQGNYLVNTAKGTDKWWSLVITGAAVNIASSAAIWLCPETASKVSLDHSSADQIEEDSEKIHFCTKEHLKNLFVGISLCVVQQFAGVNAILTNLSDALHETGVPLDDGISAVLTNVFIVIGAFSSSVLIDKMGRRPMFAISCLGCSVNLFIMAMNYKFAWSGWISLANICLYMLFFGVALGPVPWYIIPELFPLPLRSIGNSIITMSNKMSNCIVLFVYGPMLDGIGFMWTAITFAIIAFSGVFIGLFLMTEPNEALNQEEKKEEKEENSAEIPAEI